MGAPVRAQAVQALGYTNIWSGGSMLETLFSMRGKVCVATGGSSGLGSYMAQGFLEAGAERVYITARSADKLQTKAEELSALASGECIPCLLYTSPSPRDATLSRMPSSA